MNQIESDIITLSQKERLSVFDGKTWKTAQKNPRPSYLAFYNGFENFRPREVIHRSEIEINGYEFNIVN